MKIRKIKQTLSKVILISMLVTQSQIINAVSINDSVSKNINRNLDINYEDNTTNKDNKKISNSFYDENLIDLENEILDNNIKNTDILEEIKNREDSDQLEEIEVNNTENLNSDESDTNTNINDSNNTINKQDELNSPDDLSKKEDMEDLKSKELKELKALESDGKDNKQDKESIAVITSFEELKEAIQNEKIEKIIINKNTDNINIIEELIVNRYITIEGQEQNLILSEVEGKNIIINQDGHLVIENITIKNNTTYNFDIDKHYGGIENNGYLEIKDINLIDNLEFRYNGYSNYSDYYEEALEYLNEVMIKKGIIENSGILIADNVLVESNKNKYEPISLSTIYNKDDGVINITNSKFSKLDSLFGNIMNEGKLNIENTEFSENNTGFISCLLNLKQGETTIDNSIIKNNSKDSGVCILNLGKLNILNSKILNNRGYDLILIVNDDRLNISNTNFSGNRLGGYGCVFNTKKGDLNIESSSFIDNSGQIGGAVANKNKVKIQNSSFERNFSLIGGAVANEGILDLYSNNFINNQAIYYGGAIANIKEYIYYNDNSSISAGNFEKVEINIYGSDNFTSNKSQVGGAISGKYINNSINILENANVIFSENKACEVENYNLWSINDNESSDVKAGGAIYDSNLEIKDNAHVSFLNNKAEVGGAIFNNKNGNYIDITSQEGVLFENNKIENPKEYDGLDIATSIYNYLNIKNATFNNNLSEKSSIYIHSFDEGWNIKLNNKNENTVSENDNLGKVYIENSYINNEGSLIGIDNSFIDTMVLANKDKHIDLSKNLFGNINSIIYYNPTYTIRSIETFNYLEPNSLNKLILNIDRSTFDTDNLSLLDGLYGDLVKTDNYVFTEFNFDNNTFSNLNSLNLNALNMNLRHNTVISEEIKVDGLAILENNIILSLENKKLSNILGENLNINDSEDKVLYKNKITLKDNFVEKVNMMQSIEDNLSNENLNLSKEIINRIEDYYMFLIFNSQEREVLTDLGIILTNMENENLENLKELEKLTVEEIWSELENELVINKVENRELYKINKDIKKLNSNTLDTANIYINLINNKDINRTINKKYSSFDKVGSEKAEVLKHYNPVKNSLASGFTRLKGISTDANDIKREIITMGSIEETKNQNNNQGDKPSIPENSSENNNSSNGSDSSNDSCNNTESNILSKENKKITEIILDANGGLFENSKKTIVVKNKEDIQLPKKKGFKLLGWSNSLKADNIINTGKLEKEIKNLSIRDKNKLSKKYYAVWEKENTKLNYTNHIAYISGYEDQIFKPESYLTREEAAQIIFNILSDEYKNDIYSNKNNFKDISTTRWSNEAISTLSNADILKGYKDGSFKYENFITRAEVASIITKLSESPVDNKNKIDKKIMDINKHWAEEDIYKCIDKKLIKGYSDETFRPDDYITRAEFVTIVNRLLDRGIRIENILKDSKTFKDININAWYYAEIIEASNTHNFSRENDKERIEEVWLSLK